MSKYINKTGLVLLLISGLAFHDFFRIESFKLGIITITYLRVVLVLTIPLLVYPTLKFQKHDVFGAVFFIFMIYGLTRMEGNIKQTFTMYCTMLAFLFLYISIDDLRLLKKIINLLATMLIVFCFLGMFELVSGHHFVLNYLDEIGDKSYDNTVAFGIYYNENDFSALLTVLLFYLMLSDFRKSIKLFFSALTFFIVIINRSQICLLGIISFLLIAYILKEKRNRPIRFIVILLLSIAMTGPIIGMIRDSSITYRTYMYSYGLKNCIEHLWFGTGIGNYGKGMLAVGYVPNQYTSIDPHNLFLELAGQFGMIWSVLFLVLLIKLLVWFSKRIRTKEELYLFGLVYIIAFVGLASSACMEKNYIYLALLAPLIFYRSYKNGPHIISIFSREQFYYR